MTRGDDGAKLMRQAIKTTSTRMKATTTTTQRMMMGTMRDMRRVRVMMLRLISVSSGRWTMRMRVWIWMRGKASWRGCKRSSGVSWPSSQAACMTRLVDFLRKGAEADVA